MDETYPKESALHPMNTSRFERAEENTGNGSFEDLFLEHWSHVYRLLVRLVGDPAEAEDLALETFLRLYQRPPAQMDERLGGWLHRVATNLGLHSIRGFKRREHYELTAGKGALDEAADTRPAEMFAGEEERRSARAALAQMNPRQAQLLVMRYSGMSYKDIAAALDVSPASVGPLLVRAERAFEKCYRALAKEEP
jgi:RNA polymerase sigma-70 factor, ECF subfamily